MTTVRIEYFALLREQAGIGEETWRTGAGTAAELYSELRQRHGFELGIDSLRVAVNDEFVEWSAPLAEGDHVVFVPPVAGG